MKKNKGFTLVELLVVIGIIAILAGVLFASFSGATDAARSAQCLTNMRALAMAANAYAASSNRYPVAGSVELKTPKLGGKYDYRSQAGWISWLCEGNYEDNDGNAVASGHKSNPIFPYYGMGDNSQSSRKNADFAIKNGALWPFCNGKREIYTCPIHVRYRKERGDAATHFSYVMNARFGWDTTKGADAIPSGQTGIFYGSLTRADRTLMFAELPTFSVEDDESEDEKDKQEGNEQGLKADCVLQYLKQPKDKNPTYASEGTDAESIGFVHTAGKGKRCAHVVFADGHTEKLVWRNGGLSPEDLTAYLCRGIDVTFNGSAGWSIPEGADE